MSNAFDRLINTPNKQNEQDKPSQVKNNAGGYVFEVSDQIKLERFLILGTDGGTYYQEEKNLTNQNLAFLVELINKDEILYWKTVRDVSVNNRAYRTSPAIMALAYLFKFGKIKDEPAYHVVQDEDGNTSYLPKEDFVYNFYTAKELFKYVIRTTTQVNELQKYARYLKIASRSYRNTIKSFYKTKDDHTRSWLATQLTKPVDNVAYQVTKYRNRHGYTHGDNLRIAHPKHLDDVIAKFALGKDLSGEEIPAVIEGFLALQEASTVQEVLRILGDPKFNMMPWEALPTQFHKSPEVWKKLFYNNALNGQALVRNITRLTKIGAFDDMVFCGDYVARLTNESMIRKTGLHPINYLNALIVHENGQVYRPNPNAKFRGHTEGYYIDDCVPRIKTWKPNQKIVDALNDGYYLSFKFVEPSKKRFFLGIDVSGSMRNAASGLDMSCAQGAAAMAMAIARTEPYYVTYGFTASLNTSQYGYYYGNRTCTPESIKGLGITPRQSMSTVFDKVQKENFGRTDCALPIEWAIKTGTDIDTFVVLTDNETWAGNRHPHVALKEYRQKRGIDAKLIVVAMTATPFSIADPKDPGMLDVVGLDSNLPKLVSEFSLGNI